MILLSIYYNNACFIEEAHGKSLGERAALMAEKWRCLSAEEKKVYESRVQEADEAPMEVLSVKERKDIMMRIARRHQTDVSYSIIQYYISYICELSYKHSGEYCPAVGFSSSKYVLSRWRDSYCADKRDLNSHPAILVTFQSHFLYGELSVKFV